MTTVYVAAPIEHTPSSRTFEVAFALPAGTRLERFEKNPVVLWNHDAASMPIARGELVQAGGSMRFLLGTDARASQFGAALDEGLIRFAEAAVVDGELLEVSLVALPHVAPIEARTDSRVVCVTRDVPPGDPAEHFVCGDLHDERDYQRRKGELLGGYPDANARPRTDACCARCTSTTRCDAHDRGEPTMPTHPKGPTDAELAAARQAAARAKLERRLDWCRHDPELYKRERELLLDADARQAEIEKYRAERMRSDAATRQDWHATDEQGRRASGDVDGDPETSVQRTARAVVQALDERRDARRQQQRGMGPLAMSKDRPFPDDAA